MSLPKSYVKIFCVEDTEAWALKISFSVVFIPGQQGVFKKHGNGHGAYTSGNGSDIACFFAHAFKMYVAR
jgi:hypothetical protein